MAFRRATNLCVPKTGFPRAKNVCVPKMAFRRAKNAWRRELIIRKRLTTTIVHTHIENNKFSDAIFLLKIDYFLFKFASKIAFGRRARKKKKVRGPDHQTTGPPDPNQPSSKLWTDHQTTRPPDHQTRTTSWANPALVQWADLVGTPIGLRVQFSGNSSSPEKKN